MLLLGIPWADDDNDRVLLQVHNDGPPIPKEMLGAIFDPLVGKNSDQNRSGLGLGLFIVNEIVSAHRGSIEVNSSAEEGTTFTVHLPSSSSEASPQNKLG